MKNPELKTKHLMIKPLSDDEVSARAQDEQNGYMRMVAKERQAEAAAHPDKSIWYTLWSIRLKESGEEVGCLGFAGEAISGTAELEYDVKPELRGSGYSEEALKAIIDWTFSMDVYTIMAEIDSGNEASCLVLEKLGFKEIDSEKSEIRYELEKPPTYWMSIYMCIGLSIGVSIGLLLNNIGTGISIGMCLGIIVGMALDASDKNHRIELKKHRPQREIAHNGK